MLELRLAIGEQTQVQVHRRDQQLDLVPADDGQKLVDIPGMCCRLDEKCLVTELQGGAKVRDKVWDKVRAKVRIRSGILYRILHTPI